MERKLTELPLEELWELFPIFLTGHSEDWAGWFEEEAHCLECMLPMDRIGRVEHPWKPYGLSRLLISLWK